MRNMKYCPKCGYIEIPNLNKCTLCNTELFEINPKWEITKERYDEFMAPKKYGEKTEAECKKALYEFCTPFFDEVVKKRPEFDQELFDRLIEREEEFWKEEYKKIDEYEEYYNKYLEPIKVKTNPHGVKCPYCNSSNTKKLSSMSRMFSGGLFGLGSGKIGKQWHCNSCGSDF